MTPEEERRFIELDARLCVAEHLLVRIFTMVAANSPDPEGDVTRMHDQLKTGAMLRLSPATQDPDHLLVTAYHGP